ncbi:30S ribosomal protein S3 [Patescibacteria group bacterium]|nr:30S ribosomal protein S3 [Patescibacteria group bacterium]
MAQKVSPIGFRLGGVKGWHSRWFSEKKKYRDNFISDLKIRELVLDKLKTASVARVDIERSPRAVTLNIYSSRPGIIIGRGGAGIEELKKHVSKIVTYPSKININIHEIKDAESDAAVIAQSMAEQLEKRVSFRRVMKQAVDRALKSSQAKGIKVMVAGRLDGADMSRREWLAEGRMPLHTLRADIDFIRYEANTTYGVVGIKVWVYKGDIFGKKATAQSEAAKN